MRNSARSSFASGVINSLFKSEFNVLLPLGAIVFAYVSTSEAAPWLRTLVIANIATLLMFVYWHWLTKCGERLGDIKPRPWDGRSNGSDADVDASRTPAALALAFEDRVNDAILQSNRYSRHAGLISLWWTPDVDANVKVDAANLRRSLIEFLSADGDIHFADDDRAWVLAPMLRSWDELETLQNKLVWLLLNQTQLPLRKIASGCAISPLHGYEARSLFDFADDNQGSQIQVHPFPAHPVNRPPLPPAPDNFPKPNWKTGQIAV